MRSALLSLEGFEIVFLLSLLSNGFSCKEKMDVCIWEHCPSRVFSTKSFSRVVEDVQVVRLACSVVWRGLPPLRVEMCP